MNEHTIDMEPIWSHYISFAFALQNAHEQKKSLQCSFTVPALLAGQIEKHGVHLAYRVARCNVPARVTAIASVENKSHSYRLNHAVSPSSISVFLSRDGGKSASATRVDESFLVTKSAPGEVVCMAGEISPFDSHETPITSAAQIDFTIELRAFELAPPADMEDLSCGSKAGILSATIECLFYR